MTRKEAAIDNFTKGYNCSQSIVLAFEDILPIDNPLLSKMASSFGGGMGRLREVCGAVSGMFLIAGLLYGYDGPETGQIKAEHYARIQELAIKFEEKHSSIICRELLGLGVRHDVRFRKHERTNTMRSVHVWKSSEMLLKYWISI